MPSITLIKSLRAVALASSVALVALSTACGDDGTIPTAVAPGFLGGTSDNHEIGVVVNSSLKAITMFQLGSPTTTAQIPLGSSATVTPVGLSLRGRKAAVPLGNAASVSLVDLVSQTVTRTFTFPSGNATGSVWANDTTFFVANTKTNKIGRVYINQSATDITSTVDVGLAPTAMVAAKGKVFAISGNIDPTTFSAVGPGIVSAINPATNTVTATLQTGGTNPTTAVVGPDSLIYVLNTGDYVGQSSLTIIDPSTFTIVTTVTNMGVGEGSINIDAAGLAYLSSFSGATTVWNTKTRTFVRASDNPVCAKLVGVCRGAADAAANSTGKLYQAFFGSVSRGQAAYIFVYSPSTFTLSDSISVGAGPIQINIRTF